MNERARQSRDNRRLIAKIGLVTVGAFVFAFALVPLYRVACEQVFAIRTDGRAVDPSGIVLDQVDYSRTVTVQFDATVHSELDWVFKPEVAEMTVHPGEVFDAWYVATNITDELIVGNATYDVAPRQAIAYFSKTECFCFTEQPLEGGQSKRMPLRFFVAPDLPEQVRTVTLSYTFFNNERATRREQERLASQAAAADVQPRG